MTRPDRETRSLLVIAGGGLLIVVLGGVLVAGVGLRGSHSDGPAATAPAPTHAPTRIAATTSTTVPARSGIEGPDVAIEAHTGDAFATTYPVVDQLATRSVLRISAHGFETSGTGYVEQCSVGGCGNLFPVQFDEGGSARLQYLVNDDFARGLTPPSACRAGDPPCFVHLRSNGVSAYLTTVFTDKATTTRQVNVEPASSRFDDGSRVRVSVTGFAPGERVQAMLCAAPDTHGTERCGAPGPVSGFTIAADGTGSTSLVVRAASVGSSGVRCGRSEQCGVVVAGAHSAVPAPVVPIAFASGPGARYDRARLVTGSAIAALLLALAAALVRGTDWRKPTEADTPDLDRAVLVDELG